MSLSQQTQTEIRESLSGAEGMATRSLLEELIRLSAPAPSPEERAALERWSRMNTAQRAEWENDFGIYLAHETNKDNTSILHQPATR